MPEYICIAICDDKSIFRFLRNVLLFFCKIYSKAKHISVGFTVNAQNINIYKVKRHAVSAACTFIATQRFLYCKLKATKWTAGTAIFKCTYVQK